MQQSSINNQRSTISVQQSAFNNHQSSITIQQSAIVVCRSRLIVVLKLALMAAELCNNLVFGLSVARSYVCLSD